MALRVPRRPVDEEQRATWIELFFDLVFVFVITRLSSLILHDLTLHGGAQALFLLLVVGYVGTQSVRNGFCALAADPGDPLRRPLVRVFWWNLVVGVIWFAGAFATGDARVAIWLVALVLDYAGPPARHWTPRLGRSDPAEWELEPSHFAERIMLFLIIAVGETIVAAGAVASTST